MEEINYNKTDLVRTLGSVNVSILQKLVNELEVSEWDKALDFEINPNKYKKGPIGEAEHIIFTFSVKTESGFRYTSLPLWKKHKTSLLKVMDEATSVLGYKNKFYPRVMLARLPAGKFIKPHTDGDKWAVVPHKIHIPIQTNDQTYFYSGAQQFHFECGKAYEVNNGLKHSVVNGGATDRIHLLFECLDVDCQSDLLKEKIDEAISQY